VSALKGALWSMKYWMNGGFSPCRVCYIFVSDIGFDDVETKTNNKPKKIGPASADYLQALTSYDLRALTFGRSAFVPLEGINVHVARGGYTGEDGFEVSLKPPSPFGRFPPSRRPNIWTSALQFLPLTLD
jgi:hypothetical protein